MNTMKATISILFGTAVLALTACNSGMQSPASQSDLTASTLPPKYLELDQFQSCLSSKQVGTSRQWCMPTSKPDNCPAQSWDQLNQLQGNDRVPDC